MTCLIFQNFAWGGGVSCDAYHDRRRKEDNCVEKSGNSAFEQWLATLPELVPENERVSYEQHMATVERLTEEHFRNQSPTEWVAEIIEKAATESLRRNDRRNKQQPS